MPGAHPAIELQGLTKTFGSIVANKDIDLTVYNGEILALLGENGSGKTTLMNMLSGIYRPDAGHIRVRLLAEKQPPFACRSLAPELEDVYLHYFGAEDGL